MIGKRKWTTTGKFLTHDEIIYSLHMSLWRLKGFMLKIYLFHQIDSHNIFILMLINRALKALKLGGFFYPYCTFCFIKSILRWQLLTSCSLLHLSTCILCVFWAWQARMCVAPTSDIYRNTEVFRRNFTDTPYVMAIYRDEVSGIYSEK